MLNLKPVKTRIRVAPDRLLTGQAAGLPAGEHEAEISLLDAPAEPPRLDAEALLVRVRAIQEKIARLLVYDNRTPDEIIGYNPSGHFERW